MFGKVLLTPCCQRYAGYSVNTRQQVACFALFIWVVTLETRMLARVSAKPRMDLPLRTKPVHRALNNQISIQMMCLTSLRGNEYCHPFGFVALFSVMMVLREPGIE